MCFTACQTKIFLFAWWQTTHFGVLISRTCEIIWLSFKFNWFFVWLSGLGAQVSLWLLFTGFITRKSKVEYEKEYLR